MPPHERLGTDSGRNRPTCSHPVSWRAGSCVRCEVGHAPQSLAHAATRSRSPRAWTSPAGRPTFTPSTTRGSPPSDRGGFERPVRVKLAPQRLEKAHYPQPTMTPPWRTSSRIGRRRSRTGVSTPSSLRSSVRLRQRKACRRSVTRRGRPVAAQTLPRPQHQSAEAHQDEQPA